MVGLLKKYFYTFCFFLCCFFQASFAGSGTDDLILRYTTGRQDTVHECYPIGTATWAVWSTARSRKTRSDSTKAPVWSDSRGKQCRRNHKYLAQARSPDFRRGTADGDATVNKMIGGGNARFVPAGNLYLEFSGHTGTNYSRSWIWKNGDRENELCLQRCNLHPRILPQAPDKVIIVRLTASAAGKISFSAYMDSPFSGTTQSTPANNLLVLNAQVNAIKFQNRLTVKTDMRTVSSGSNKIIVPGANSDHPPHHCDELHSLQRCFGNPDTRATAALQRRCGEDLRYSAGRISRSYTALFDRVDLNLGTETTQNLTMDARVSKFSSSNDPPDSSVSITNWALPDDFPRPGRFPAGEPPRHLEQDTYPTWGSKYTTNINLEMNYWMTETANPRNAPNLYK